MRAMAPLLPADILHRRKKGFGVPIGAWFKDGELGSSSSSLPLLNNPFVQAKLAEHRAGQADQRAFLWNAWLLGQWQNAPAA